MPRHFRHQTLKDTVHERFPLPGVLNGQPFAVFGEGAAFAMRLFLKAKDGVTVLVFGRAGISPGQCAAA